MKALASYKLGYTCLGATLLRLFLSLNLSYFLTARNPHKVIHSYIRVSPCNSNLSIYCTVHRLPVQLSRHLILNVVVQIAISHGYSKTINLLYCQWELFAHGFVGVDSSLSMVRIWRKHTAPAILKECICVLLTFKSLVWELSSVESSRPERTSQTVNGNGTLRNLSVSRMNGRVPIRKVKVSCWETKGTDSLVGDLGL